MKTIKIKCQGADSIPFESIEIFQGNLKKLSKQNLNKLKSLILKLGFCAPFFIWQNDGHNWSLDGTQRDRALKSLQDEGYEIPLIPVAYIEADSEQDAREKLLAISSQFGAWDLGELDEWLENIDNDIKEQFRFLEKEIDIKIEDETVNDDEVKDIEYVGIIKEGDLIELNKHRLICGDNQGKDILEKILITDDKQIGFTSPPYNMGNFGFKGMNKSVYAGKSDDIKNYDKMLINTINNYFKYCKFVLFNIQTNRNNFADVMTFINEYKYNICDIIIWHKTTTMPVSKNNVLNNDYEYIIILNRDKPIKRKSREIIIDKKFNNISNIFNLDRNRKNKFAKIHRATFTIEFVLYLINIITSKEINIVDIFMGLGTSIIACEKDGRIAYGVERDPYYCEVIINRFIEWCKDNDRPAEVKINGIPYKP